MQVGAKAALCLGVILLLGAGVFARWIASGPVSAPLRRRLRAGAWVGAFLLAAGSALDVIDTVSRALGRFDPSAGLSYLSETRAGNAALARLAVVVLLLLLGLGRRRPAAAERAAFVTLGLALLTTFSIVSHAGAQPGVLPVSADLGHLIGVTGWGGALVYGAWLIPWRASGPARASVERAAARLSTVGLWCVTLIAATGVYASLVQLWGPRALTDTPYGRVLLIKLAVVSSVAAVAAINRWVVLPSLARGPAAARLGGLVKVESLLLLAVLGVTAVLVSQPPPGPPPTLSRPLTFRTTVGPWTARGTVERRDPGRFAIDLSLQGTPGAPAPTVSAVSLTLTMLDMQMAPVETGLAEVRPGVYQGRFFLPMSGRWQMTIHAGGSTARVPIRTDETVFIRPLSPWKVVLPGVAVVLVGLGLVIAGLRRMGAGVRGSLSELGAGVMLVIIGVVLAVRAVS
jgi:putative copper export protein